MKAEHRSKAPQVLGLNIRSYMEATLLEIIYGVHWLQRYVSRPQDLCQGGRKRKQTLATSRAPTINWNFANNHKGPSSYHGYLRSSCPSRKFFLGSNCAETMKMFIYSGTLTSTVCNTEGIKLWKLVANKLTVMTPHSLQDTVHILPQNYLQQTKQRLGRHR